MSSDRRGGMATGQAIMTPRGGASSDRSAFLYSPQSARTPRSIQGGAQGGYNPVDQQYSQLQYQQQQQASPAPHTPRTARGGSSDYHNQQYQSREEKETMSHPVHGSPLAYQNAADADEQARVEDALARGLCICEVCTCGKHYCPASVHLQARYEGLSSSYKSSFVPHTERVVRARAPPSTVFASGEKFEGTSATKSDYVNHVGARPAPMFKPEVKASVVDEESRDFKSENRSNFKNHGYARAPMAHPQDSMYLGGEPFQGTSTLRSDYPKWESRPAQLVKPSPRPPPSGADDRDFLTTNGANFNEKGYVARPTARPFTSNLFDDGSERFQPESTTRESYRAWNQAKPATPCKPPVDQVEYHPEDRAFRTEKQEHFTPKGTPGVVRHRAPPSQVLESAPFEGASVTKSTYSPHVGARPAPMFKPEVKASVVDEESRDFKSENRSNFKNHGYARAPMAHPQDSMYLGGEPFQGTSTLRSDYQRWNAKPATPVKPLVSPAPSGPEDRDFLTTNGANFNTKGYVARPTARPFTSNLFEDGSEGFQGSSTSRESYKQWELSPRSKPQRENKVVAANLLYHHEK